MLETETDRKVYVDIQDVLIHMSQTLGPNHLMHWLQLCHATLLEMKWQTKAFAIHCLHDLINYCEQTTQLDFLIKSSSFACTSTYDPLRLSGLSLLKQIILKLIHIENDMDLSKQHQEEIIAAIQSTFSQQTSSHVTIQACDVCQILISSDLYDLRRVYQLLISSLQKLTSIQQQIKSIHNESVLTNESLAILKLWADIYNFAVIQSNSNIQTELSILIYYWIAASIDYAFLMLPKEFNGTNSPHGYFYSNESNVDLIRRIYRANWSSIIQAATQWLVEHHYEFENSKTELLASALVDKIRRYSEKKEDLFMILFGCCVDALSTSVSEQTEETFERILVSSVNLLRSDLAKRQITVPICMELITVLHR